MEPLVSILIPAYNAEKWIGDTIRSALNQTWPRKEIIIVNDGSSDNTLAKARLFESGSLKVISQENRGASAARNRALSYAQGDYIQWLDADDLLAPDKISVQMIDADDDRTSLRLFSSSFGIFSWRWEKAIFSPDALWQDLTPIEWLINYFNEDAWMSPAVWLVSRKLTEKAGPWNERLSLNDDGEYFSRVITASDMVKFVRGAKCYYRLSGCNQLSQSISESASRSLFLSSKHTIQHIMSLEDSDRTRRSSLILLQNIMPHFYPDKTEMLGEIEQLARELSGNLTTMTLDSKWDMLRRVLGWKMTKKIMNGGRKYKLMIKVYWDWVMYTLVSGKSKNNREKR